MRIGILIVLVMFTSGCVIHRPSAQLDPQPYLIHLHGAGGLTLFDRQFVSAIRAGGFNAEMRVHDWMDWRLPVAVLKDLDGNREQARIVAQIIEKQYRDNPLRPIYITGESAGTAIAVWALEELDDDVRVAGVLLIASAISPTYDLSKSLERVEDQMIVFTSPRDSTLDWGTRFAGTMDRKRVQAAGRVGFVRPNDVEESAYNKLVQISYDPKWRKDFWHTGEHADGIMSRFASGYIAPLLVQMEIRRRLANPSESTGNMI